MTTEINLNGKTFAIIESGDQGSEKHIAAVKKFRELKSAGYSDPVITSGKYSGTEVVATFNKIWDETKVKPLILAK